MVATLRLRPTSRTERLCRRIFATRGATAAAAAPKTASKAFPSETCFSCRETGLRRCLGPLIALALSAAAGLASASAQQPRIYERVEVTRVLVDARVVDGGGNAVRGLEAADFRVRLGGKPAPVESAQWVGDEPSGTALAPLPSAPLVADVEPEPRGRLIVLLFQKDFDGSRLVGLMRMLVETQGFLDGLTPDDRVAVLSFDYHLKVWLDFTNDRERLRWVLQRGILLERPLPVEPTGTPSLVERLDPALGRRTWTIEEGLRLLGDALKPLRGSKAVVLIGHGFGRLGPTGVAMEHNYGETVDALVAARASVFSLDVTNADYHSLEAGLQFVARDTGGFFARTHLFSTRALQQLAGALAGHYVLFVEKPEGLEPGVHPIDVSLTRRKGSVLARRAYVE